MDSKPFEDMSILNDMDDEYAHTLFPHVDQPDKVYTDAIAMLHLDKFPFISNSIIDESVSSVVDSTPSVMGDRMKMLTLAGNVIKSIHAFVEHVGRDVYTASAKPYIYRNIETHQILYLAVTKWLETNRMAVLDRNVWTPSSNYACSNMWEYSLKDTKRMMHDCIPLHTPKECVERMWKLMEEEQYTHNLKILPVFGTIDGKSVVFGNQSCMSFDVTQLQDNNLVAYRHVLPVTASSIVGKYMSPESVPYSDHAEIWIRFLNSITAMECIEPLMFWIAAAVQPVEERNRIFKDCLRFVLVIDDSNINGAPNDLLCGWSNILQTIANSSETMKGNCIMNSADPPRSGWLHWALKSDTAKISEGWKTRSHLCVHYDHVKHMNSGVKYVPELLSCVGFICQSVSIMNMCKSHPFVMNEFDMTVCDSSFINPPKNRALSSIGSKMTKREIWEEIVLTQYMWKPVQSLPGKIDNKQVVDAMFKYCITVREILTLINHWAKQHGVTVDPVSIQLSPGVALLAVERYYGKNNTVKIVTMCFDRQWALTGLASIL